MPSVKFGPDNRGNNHGYVKFYLAKRTIFKLYRVRGRVQRDVEDLEPSVMSYENEERGSWPAMLKVSAVVSKCLNRDMKVKGYRVYLQREKSKEDLTYVF
jgi:hypothetical protein